MSSVLDYRRGNKRCVLPEETDYTLVPADAWPIYWDALERYKGEWVGGRWWCGDSSFAGAAPEYVEPLDILPTNIGSTPCLCPVCKSDKVRVYQPSKLGLCFECKHSWRRWFSVDDRSRITAWLEPYLSTICGGCGRPESKYGAVTNQEWLRRESERINEGGHTCRIVAGDDGKQALFYVDGYFENGLWVKARPEECGKPQNVVQQAKCRQPVLA